MKKLSKIYGNEWNKTQKNPSGSYHFRLMYDSPLVRILLEKNLYPYKITTLQELRPDDSESRLEYCN
jgi:hypothetical protein